MVGEEGPDDPNDAMDDPEDDAVESAQNHLKGVHLFCKYGSFLDYEKLGLFGTGCDLAVKPV